MGRVTLSHLHLKNPVCHLEQLSKPNPHSLQTHEASTRFLSSPFMIMVSFFLLLGFNKGAQKEKGQKGTTQEPSQRDPTSHSEQPRARTKKQPTRLTPWKAGPLMIKAASPHRRQVCSPEPRNPQPKTPSALNPCEPGLETIEQLNPKSRHGPALSAPYLRNLRPYPFVSGAYFFSRAAA